MTFEFFLKRMFAYVCVAIVPTLIGVSGHHLNAVAIVFIGLFHLIIFSGYLALSWFGRPKSSEA